MYVYTHIKKVYIYTHTNVYVQWNITQLKKRMRLPFVTIHMDLDGIMLNEINQRKMIYIYMISLICGIRKKKKLKKPKSRIRPKNAENKMMVARGKEDQGRAK